MNTHDRVSAPEPNAETNTDAMARMRAVRDARRSEFVAPSAETAAHTKWTSAPNLAFAGWSFPIRAGSRWQLTVGRQVLPVAVIGRRQMEGTDTDVVVVETTQGDLWAIQNTSEPEGWATDGDTVFVASSVREIPMVARKMVSGQGLAGQPELPVTVRPAPPSKSLV